jgi:hypothetical protein
MKRECSVLLGERDEEVEIYGRSQKVKCDLESFPLHVLLPWVAVKSCFRSRAVCIFLLSSPLGADV